MPKVKPSRGIHSVTEFRANAAQFIEQLPVAGKTFTHAAVARKLRVRPRDADATLSP